jgi:pimeloyl-ACP methyl ester carboxylesterase
METYLADGVRLEYQVRGDGEPLLLIHGGMIADAFEALADKLTSTYQLITYRRRGFHGTPAHENCTISKAAADAVALLDHLGIATAHVTGHSYGATTALQLAVDAPMRAHTLGLLEPTLMAAPSAASFGSEAAAIGGIFQSGDSSGTLVAFLTLVGGPDPLLRLDKGLPAGWFDQAVADLPTLWTADLPSFGSWEFDRKQAATITQPALTVLGSRSAPLFAESHDLLTQWLPNAEPFVLQGATHMLQWEDPSGIASCLLAFLARHPIG